MGQYAVLEQQQRLPGQAGSDSASCLPRCFGAGARALVCEGSTEFCRQDTATACVYMYVRNCSASGDTDSSFKFVCSAHFLSSLVFIAFHHLTWALLF